MPTPTLAEVLSALKVDRGRRDPRGIIVRLGQMVQALPEQPVIGPADRQTLVEVLAILQCIRRYSGPADGLHTVELMTLGKLGRFSAAVRRARQAYRDDPTWANAVAAGNALRRAGGLTAAVKMFSAAAELDPSDVTALLEVGDIALEAGRLLAALAAYERVLDREPGHAWADPSALYCRFVQGGNLESLDRLREAAASQADHCGVGAALDRLAGNRYTDETRKRRATYLLGRAKAADAEPGAAADGGGVTAFPGS